MTAFSRRGFLLRDVAQLNIKQLRCSNNRNNALSRCCPTSLTSCIVNILSKKFSSIKTPISSDAIIEALTNQQAKELTSKLTSEERKLFLVALNECKSEEEKAGYKGQLAAFRWRSKLGRPSKIPSLGEVDPTGTFCPMPDDWLNRKYDVAK